MDENKSMTNNDEAQASNNMNYSFDFANQVDKTEAPVTPEVNSASANTVIQESAPTVDQSAPAEVNTEAAPSPAETPVTPVTPETVVTPETPVTPVTPETVVTPETPVVPVTPETVVTPETPVVPVTPVTPETVATETKENEEDSIELIQDKKATKRFLIILFVVIIAFIIALPFIFSVAG